MRNELQKHKKSDKIKWIATALAVVMLGVGVTAAITKGFKDWNPYGWFDKKTEQPTDKDNPPIDEVGAYDENGNNLADGNIHAMPLSLTFTGAKTLASNTSNDITTNEDGTKEVTVQATLNREIEMTFAWSVDWGLDNVPESAVIGDYITLTVGEDTSICTIKMLQAFGYQAILKCESMTVTGLYATTYVRCRPVSFGFHGGSAIEYKVTDAEKNTSTCGAANSPVKVSRTIPITDAGVTLSRDDVWNFTSGIYSQLGNNPYSDTGNPGAFTSFKYKLSFYGLQETDGYGFNNDFYISEPQKFGGYGRETFSFKLNTQSLVDAFYYDAAKGYTAEDFYTYGLALLKGNDNLCILKITYEATLRDEFGGGIMSVDGYYTLDLSAVEGLNIDINGMQNVIF